MTMMDTHVDGPGNGARLRAADLPAGAVTDLGEASVLTMFFLQALGKASVDQVVERMQAAGLEIAPDLVEQAAEALRARGFASYTRGKVPPAGGSGHPVSVRMHKPKNSLWRNPPEVAQVTRSFLADLVATPEARRILAGLNELEREGKGEGKATERMKYADYVDVEIDCRVLDRFLGGRIGADAYNQELVRRGPRTMGADLVLPRDGAGRPVIPTSNLKGWLAGALRSENLSAAVVDYLFLEPARFEGLPDPIPQVQEPVCNPQGRRGQAGLGTPTYEALPAGVTFTLRLGVPTRGFPEVRRFVLAVARCGPRAPRGLSNGRSGEYGHFEVLGWREVGRSQDASRAVASVGGSVSPEARAVLEALAAALG